MSNEPLIHFPYPNICQLISSIMNKFIRNKYFLKVYSRNVNIDCFKTEHLKPIEFIHIGTKAKSSFSNNSFQSEEYKEKIFCRECTNFYIKVTSYLQSHLPVNVKLIEHMKCLHPENRKEPGITNAISNLALTLAFVSENKKRNVLEISNSSKEQVCDFICSQWMLNQSEEIAKNIF